MVIAKGGKRLSPVVARIMDGGQLWESGFINLDSSFFDVCFQKLKYAEYSELIVDLWKPCLKPEPGRKVGVASFWIKDGLRFDPPGVFYDAFDLYFHVRIVS